MVDLNLKSGEGILHRTQTLIISGVRYEAVFTTTRLILVTSDSGTVYEEIPYAEIRLAVSGINKLREPVITLSIELPGGEKRTRELIFLRQAGDLSNASPDKCITVLREQKVPVEIQGPWAGPEFSGSGQRNMPVEPGVEEQINRPAVPDWTVFGTYRKEQQPVFEDVPERSPLVIISAVLFIVLALVIGLVFAGQMLTVKNATANQSMAGPDTTRTMIPPASPEPSPSPGPQVTSGPVSLVPEQTIPKNGVWVRISYPGNYSGDIGAQGRQIGVNNSGDQFYKIPVNNAMIEGSIGKMDGSAKTLEVGIYNGGGLISKSETDKPWGVVDIHFMVGPALGNPVVTEAPVPETTVSPYISLPPPHIPASGVWVRVFSPGNYTGSIRANGRITSVNSTGDQVFSIPVTSGILDSSFEKREGTADTLIIEVYRNGNLISRTYTTTPFGVADIHTKI